MTEVEVSRGSMFEIPIIKMGIEPWDEIKPQLLNLYDTNFRQSEYDKYHTNFTRDKNLEYSKPIWDILEEYVNYLITTFLDREPYDRVPNIWAQKYPKGSLHPLHNHGNRGYSCILYLNFDSKIHKPTLFYAPFNHFFTGELLYFEPEVSEGDLIMFPSCIAHTSQLQEDDSERMIISFNLYANGR